MDGDITLKVGEGGLMGEPLMVALFWVAFLPSGGRVDLSLSQYADDTTKQIFVELAEDVHALAKRVRCSNDVFDRAPATDGFSQNRGKEELFMHLVREVSLADRRLVRGFAAREGRHSREAPGQPPGRKGNLRSRAA